MSDTKPLSILDERPPPRGLSFEQMVIIAALIIFVELPILVVLLIFLTGGPR